MQAEWARALGADDAAAYDALVDASPSGHAFQTRRWAAVATTGSFRSTSFVTVRAGAQLVGAALVLRPRVAGVPLPWARIERGPVVAEVSLLGDCLGAIEVAARARGLLRLHVMPYWADADADAAEGILRRKEYRDVQSAGGSHARTLRIALPADDARLFAGPAMGQVRWRSGQATRRGATARKGTPADWPRLRAMHATLMRSQGRAPPSAPWWSALEAFVDDDARGALFVCEHDGRVVSGCVALRHARQVTYAWGASVADHLPFTKAIPALVAAIRWARDCGCTTFDLGGIPLEGDTDPKRAAIATLKHDFSREPVRLVREHARWLVP